MKGIEERLLARLLVSQAVILSLSGIAYAVLCSGEAVDGGRGGAVAVALALAGYFLRADLSRKVEEIVSGAARTHDAIDELSPATAPNAHEAALRQCRMGLDGLKGRLDSMGHSQTRINRAMAMATAIGTLTWGFADMLVTKML